MTRKLFIAAATLVTGGITTWLVWPSATETQQATVQAPRTHATTASTTQGEIPARQSVISASQATYTVNQQAVPATFTGVEQTIDSQYLQVQGVSEGENYFTTKRVNDLPITPSDYIDQELINQLTAFTQQYPDNKYSCLGSLRYFPSNHYGSLEGSEQCSEAIENLARSLRMWIYINTNAANRGEAIDDTADFSMQSISHSNNDDRHTMTGKCFYQKAVRGAKAWCTLNP